MMDFYSEHFEGICNFFAIINIIIFAIAGYIIGKAFGDIPITLLFAAIGIGFGILYNILAFGLVAQFIEMKHSLNEIKKTLQNIQYQNENNSSSNGPIYPNKNANTTGYNVPPSENTWVCRKCGHKNAGNNDLCTMCGEYR